jgi:serine/threonine protein phosphatase PrpC
MELGTIFVAMTATLELERGRPRIFHDHDVNAVEVVQTPAGRAAMFSLTGPGKTGPNEDACAVFGYGEESCILVVADGVGGERSGSEASRLAVEALAASVAEGALTGLRIRNAILNGIDRANNAVIELGSGAATTIAVMQIEGRNIRPYHVGDSMVLVVGQRGKVKHQNIPHGPVGYAVEAGLLDESEALHHEERNVVSNVIGAADMRIEVGPRLSIAPRDTVLLASDGLSDNLYPEEIVDGIRIGPLPESTQRLADRCRKRMTQPREGRPSKPDDLTLIAFRLS